MADHLFGDMFEDKPAAQAKPGESHLFGDMFPKETPAAATKERGADIAKIAKLILLGSPGRLAYDKGYREEVKKEIDPLFQKHGWDLPEPFTEKPIIPEIAKSIGRGVTAPGRALMGGYRAAPEKEGEWSEVDQWRQNQLDDLMMKDAGAFAGIAITGGIPNVLRSGASSIPFLNVGTLPETAALARTAIEKYGYPVRPGQMSENWMVRSLDSLLNKLPFSGYRANAEAQQIAINRGVAREIGERSETVTPEVMRRARDRMRDSYESLFRTEVAEPDAQFIGNVRRILNQADEAVDTEGKMRVLSNSVRNVLDKIGPDGTISGRAYQGLRNEGSTLKVLSKRPDDVGHFAGQLRNELDALFRRSVSPENRDTLRTLDQQYAIMKNIRPLVDETGDISPAKLMGRQRAGNAGLDRVAFGEGGDLVELANIGQRFKTMPSSNTAENTMMLNLLANPLSLGFGGAGIGAALGGLPAMLAGGALGAGATRATGAFMASPSRAENMILRALGERGAVGQELPHVGAVPFLPAIEAEQGPRRIYMDMSG